MADILGITPSKMANKRGRLGLKPNKGKRDTYELTDEELHIICGTLLGDATIRYVHNQCKYPNLTFSHSTKQEQYFNWKANKLHNLMSSSNNYKTTYTRTNGELAYKLTYTGYNMACLVNIRNTFYDENGIKHIPIEYLNKYFNEVSLYCLFMDDGSYDISSNSYIINTQCFSIDDLKLFVKLLYDKFRLEFNIKTDHCLYLKHISNSQFQKILKTVNECPEMNYKLGSCHKIPLNGKTPKMDDSVLNPLEIEKMPNDLK